jgi:small subunit ribosomal protein S7
MRGKRAKKRQVTPDAVYNSGVVTKFVNKVMRDGKKAVAFKAVYSAMEKAAKELKIKPIEAIEKAIENVGPKIEIRPRRVGGVNYQVPVPVEEGRQLSLAINWIVTGARARRKKETFSQALADELTDANKNTGFAIKKKEDTHKMAEANKAFAHFQW